MNLSNPFVSGFSKLSMEKLLREESSPGENLQKGQVKDTFMVKDRRDQYPTEVQGIIENLYKKEEGSMSPVPNLFKESEGAKQSTNQYKGSEGATQKPNVFKENETKTAPDPNLFKKGESLSKAITNFQKLKAGFKLKTKDAGVKKSDKTLSGIFEKILMKASEELSETVVKEKEFAIHYLHKSDAIRAGAFLGLKAGMVHSFSSEEELGKAMSKLRANGVRISGYEVNGEFQKAVKIEDVDLALMKSLRSGALSHEQATQIGRHIRATGVVGKEIKNLLFGGIENAS